MDEFWQPQEMAEQRERDRAATERIRRDLADVLAIPAGRRVIASELAAMGMGRKVTQDNINLFNLAMAILSDVNQINGAAALEILAACFALNVSIAKQGDDNV